MKIQISLFIAAVLSTIYCMVIAYLFVAYLNPTLPLIPAAMAFIGLVCAGYAGTRWQIIMDWADENS